MKLAWIQKLEINFYFLMQVVLKLQLFLLYGADATIIIFFITRTKYYYYIFFKIIIFYTKKISMIILLCGALSRKVSCTSILHITSNIFLLFILQLAFWCFTFWIHFHSSWWIKCRSFRR